MTFDAGRIRHDAVLMHSSRQSNGSSAPSNWTLRATGDTGMAWTPESTGTPSFGSNSNEVSFANAAGASSLASRADHVHRGVTSLSHSSNTYTGPVTLETEGSLYIVRPSANTYRLGSTSSGGGGASISYSSNSSYVSEISIVGIETSVARSDHYHGGVGQVTSSSSNTLQRGTVNFRAGANVGITATDTDGDGEFDTLTIHSSASGGGGASVSYGSNSNAVDVFASAAGASSLVSRADHVHFMAPRLPLDRDRTKFDATFGDDFLGYSLDGKWSRHNQTQSEETYHQGAEGSALVVTHGTSNAAEYIYQTAPNNTNETWEACLTLEQRGNTTGQMFGILMLTTAGTGVATMIYDNSPGIYIANVTSHTFASSGANRIFAQSIGQVYQNAATRLFIRMRKASGLYASSYSFDGHVYSTEASFTPTGFTPTRVGIGRFLGTSASSIVTWHWFDKTA